MATALAHTPSTEQRLLTAEEFLDWLEPGVFVDLIGGKIFRHSPVTLGHARLINFSDCLLRLFVEHEDLGELHRESVAIRLSVREAFLPDLAFFTKAQVPRLLASHAPFAPTFVLEALSPATKKNDTGRKFAAYELHGVEEYWILDPERLQHRFFRRQGDMLIPFATEGERIESTSIKGFWVKRSWLNPAKIPAVTPCLAEILAARKPRARRR